MKKSIIRIVALITAAIALTALFTACVPFGTATQSPSVDTTETELTVPYSERKLIFVQSASAIQVNLTSIVGYFCYEDNQLRILTENSKVGDVDDSVAFTVTVYGGEKLEDGSNAVSSDKYTAVIAENGYLTVSSEVIGDIEIDASCANGSKLAEKVLVPVTRRSLSVWDIVMLGIGLYLLFAAITGKGKLYDAEFVKEGKEQQHKLIIRITCLVVALLMIATGVVSALDGYGKYKLVNTILFIVMLVVFAVALFLLRSCTDRKAKKEAQEKRLSGRDLKAPSAAFDFDDDEPTVDDLARRRRESDEE